MAYEIEFSEDAERHLEALGARDRKIVLGAIEKCLAWEPDLPAKNLKLLRANPLASWELRVGLYRVFYNVMGATVLVVAIGMKQHNVLFLDGKEYPL